MIFDVYFPHRKKDGTMCPGFKPTPMEWSQVLYMLQAKTHQDLIDKYRETGEKALKDQITAICYVGKCQTDYRMAANCLPTQLVMVDIDHIKSDPVMVWKQMYTWREKEWWVENLFCAHITVGGQGLRIVFKAREGLNSLEENMEWFRQEFQCDQFGDFDACTKDYCRISFLPKPQDFLFLNSELAEVQKIEPEILVNEYYNPDGAEPEKKSGSTKKPDWPELTEEDIKRLRIETTYRGVSVGAIVDKWIEVKGEPGPGEKHNFYNEMVKYFRNIVDNKKETLFAILPRFGHTEAECWSSIVSICKANTLSRLDRPFWFFLRDNGFLRDGQPKGAMAEYLLAEEEGKDTDRLPSLPPVFRELVATAPKDFKISVVNSLLPILGTLTSYLKATYWYDAREHTTSFFSVIYAPPGTGKGFVERFNDLLFENIKLRDYVQNARDAVFMRAYNSKSDSEKKPQQPETSLRLMPSKNSESEFLEKMRNNQGYHMFTYAAEMDSWAKGVKAAGGNKDDMIRIAWDNGEYGQQFKATNTFKGKVRLYWNVLITGSLDQLFNYFKNVQNGLVTRCSFTTIYNQEYAVAPIWKPLSKKSLDNIHKFMERCDRMSYTEPCELLPADVDCVDDKDFDKEIAWRFKFRPKREVNMDWLKPTIDEFLNTNLKRAALDCDKARDVFRRRAAVRGFRLGILCYALWEKPTLRQLNTCIPFIRWWMQQDLDCTLELWGSRYNEVAQDLPSLNQKSLFLSLSNEFDKNDVYIACQKSNIKTPIRNIIYRWKQVGAIKEIKKGIYQKIGGQQHEKNSNND